MTRLSLFSYSSLILLLSQALDNKRESRDFPKDGLLTCGQSPRFARPHPSSLNTPTDRDSCNTVFNLETKKKRQNGTNHRTFPPRQHFSDHGTSRDIGVSARWRSQESGGLDPLRNHTAAASIWHLTQAAARSHSASHRNPVPRLVWGRRPESARMRRHGKHLSWSGIAIDEALTSFLGCRCSSTLSISLHPSSAFPLTRFIRAMFLSGRNSRTVPSSCLYAFMPSNRVNA